MGSAPGQVPQPEGSTKVYASVYSGVSIKRIGWGLDGSSSGELMPRSRCMKR
jgi:hypothetical protein